MKNKTLLEQLNRMSSLMGKTPSLLNEQPQEILAKTGEELWNYTKKLFTTGTERTAEESIERSVRQIEGMVGREEAEMLERILRQNAAKGAEEMEARIVEYISKSKAVQEKVYQAMEQNYQQEMVQLMDKSINDSKEILDSFYKNALERSGGDIEQAQEVLKRVLEDDLANPKMLDRYFEKVEAVEGNAGWEIKTKGEPEVTPNRPSVEETLENDPDLRSATDEAAEEIERLSQENLGQPQANISQTYLPTWLRFYTKYWKNMFTSNATLLNKINDKMAQIDAKLAKTPPEVIDVDMEDLYMLILGLRKSRSTDVASTMKKLMVNNPKLSEATKKLFQSSEFESSWKALAQSETKNTYGPVEEQLRAWAQSFPVTNFIEKVFSKEKFEVSDWWKLLLPNPKRVGMQIVWKDPRTNAEVVRHLTQYGRNRAIASKILTFVVFSHGIVPMIIASMKTIGQNYKHWSTKADYAIAEELCQTLKELGEDCKGLPSVTPKPSKEDFWKYFKGSLPFDYFGIHPYGEDNSLLKNAFFWTYLDEILEVAWSSGEFLMFGDFDESKLKNLYDLLEAKTKKNLNDLGWDTNKSQEENLKNLKERLKKEKEEHIDPIIDDGKEKVDELQDKFEDTDAGFKAWCLKNGHTYQGFDPYHIGTTSDGKTKTWAYDISKNTFVEY